MSVRPTVSVLIPVFNRKNLVGDAIRSVLAQSIDRLEVIVGDNHSDDGTWELLQQFKDTRVQIFRNESNVGLFGNFNRCAERARGEFALFLCSDDRLTPNFLSSALDLMREHATTVLLSSRGRMIDSAGRGGRVIADHFPPGKYDGRSAIPAWFWTSYHYGANPLNYPSGILLRTSALERCLPFRAEFGAVADIDMYLRILTLGDMVITNTIGCLVMRHSEQEGKIAWNSAELFRHDVALLAEFKSQLESMGVYREICDQISCLALAAALRLLRTDPPAAYALFKEFGRKPTQILFAASKSAGLIFLDKVLGQRRVPHLKSARRT
jgi:GT2 family glycosyltransferase